METNGIDYRELGAQDFLQVFKSASTQIRGRYGITIKKLATSLQVTGDFDGTTISVRKDMDEELQLFILLHLFGHTVQFNSSEELRRIGLSVYGPGNISEETLEAIRAYERNASRYALWLLHEIGVINLDQWVSDWSNADMEYLIELYKTGAKYELSLEFLVTYKAKYIKYGSELLTPLAVPPFTPKQWESRFSF